MRGLLYCRCGTVDFGQSKGRTLREPKLRSEQVSPSSANAPAPVDLLRRGRPPRPELASDRRCIAHEPDWEVVPAQRFTQPHVTPAPKLTHPCRVCGFRRDHLN